MHVDGKQHGYMASSYRSLPTYGRCNAGVDHTHIATNQKRSHNCRQRSRYGYRSNRKDSSYWSLGKCIKSSIDECGGDGKEKVGGLYERLVGGLTNCSLDAATVCRQFGIRLNYLPCLPANEHDVPGVRNCIGRCFITEHCYTEGLTWPTHVRLGRVQDQQLLL